MGAFTEHKRLLGIAQAANVPVTLGHEELAILLDALVEQETELANLERQLLEFADRCNEMGSHHVLLQMDFADAQKRIAELEERLPPDSTAGLGNEFKAWDAASDQALSRFEEGLDKQ